jgi:hypothetical protein
MDAIHCHFCLFDPGLRTLAEPSYGRLLYSARDIQLRMKLRSRIKQRLHLIFIKEFVAMHIVRIYVQDDARRYFLHFLTMKDIPVHDERDPKVLTSSRFTQAC